jgi:hypothetical protein
MYSGYSVHVNGQERCPSCFAPDQLPPVIAFWSLITHELPARLRWPPIRSIASCVTRPFCRIMCAMEAEVSLSFQLFKELRKRISTNETDALEP